MGGCCCSSRGAVVNTTPPAYYYYPRAPGDGPPLSSLHSATSPLSMGLLVNTNLDTSTPDTYRPPPTPIPYDVALGYPQTPLGFQEICSNKSGTGVQTTNTDSVQEKVSDVAEEAPAKCEDVEEPKTKLQTDVELVCTKECELEITKPVEPIVSAADEEDVCPTCLEEYDPENPKIMTQCEHHFHLSCILEWLERSDTCPLCDQEMIFSLPDSIDQ